MRYLASGSIIASKPGNLSVFNLKGDWEYHAVYKHCRIKHIIVVMRQNAVIAVPLKEEPAVRFRYSNRQETRFE